MNWGDYLVQENVVTWIEYQRIVPLHVIVRPNPVRSEFQISCTIPDQGLLQIAWKDQLGRSVWVVNEGYRIKGLHEIRAKVPPNLPQGLYICEVRACGQSLNQRIIISGD